MPSSFKPWTAAEVAKLRRYAGRGLSIREAAKLLERTTGSVLNKAAQERIAFHGPSGAPPLNTNGAATRFRPANKASEDHQKQSRDSKTLPLCRVCGERVADPAAHYRSVHLVR